jgi:hypothetical protein
MDTQTVLNAVLVLLVLLGLFALVASVIGMLLGYAIKWLRERKQVQRLGMVVSQSVRLRWNQHKPAVERWLEFGWEILVNPLFFGFMVYALFNRITSITDYVATHPEISLWQQLNADVEQDVNFYIWISIIFTIWMLGKAWIHGNQKYVERTIIKVLEANTKASEANTKASEASTKASEGSTKVLEAIARKIGVPESEYKVTDTKPDAKPDTELDRYKDF